MTTRQRLRLAMLRAVGAALPSRRAHLPPRPRLLVLRPDHIGDLLWMLPALEELRRALPEAGITLAAGPWVEPFARLAEGVDAVEVVAFPGFERGPRGGLAAPYGLAWRLARRWRGHYDACLVARPDHWWGAMTAALAAIPCRIGRLTPETAPFLTDALALGPHEHEVTANVTLARFAAATLLDAAGPAGAGHGDRIAPRDPAPASAGGPSAATGDRGVGPRGRPPGTTQGLPDATAPGSYGDSAPSTSAITPEAYPLRLPLPPDARQRAAAWARRQLGCDSGYVCVHPGAGGATKLWPVPRYEALVRGLVQTGRPIVVTGSLAEIDLATRVADAGGAAVSAAGEFDLLELAALLEGAALVVGSDSGPLHIATAVGTRTVHIYGPADEVKFGPWSPASRHRVLTAAVPCRPCGDLNHCVARDELGCMRRVPVEAVLAACNELLAGT